MTFKRQYNILYGFYMILIRIVLSNVSLANNCDLLRDRLMGDVISVTSQSHLRRNYQPQMACFV